MKITFPHMGYSYIAFKMLLNELGYEVVVPPEPSKRTITWVSGMHLNSPVFLLRCCWEPTWRP